MISVNPFFRSCFVYLIYKIKDKNMLRYIYDDDDDEQGQIFDIYVIFLFSFFYI